MTKPGEALGQRHGRRLPQRLLADKTGVLRRLTAQPRPGFKGVSLGVMSEPQARYPFSSRRDSSAR
jgi:hypothetical protein